ALVVCVVFCWYARALVGARWLKSTFIVIVFASIAAISMTRARGGSLALATVLLLIWSRSGRKVGLAVMLALLIVPSIYLTWDQYFARMSTLTAPTADSSANSRLVLDAAALHLWTDHPLLGVGVGNQNAINELRYYLPDTQYANLKVHN